MPGDLPRTGLERRLDRAHGDGRCEQRRLAGDGADAAGRLLGTDVLEQKAASAGPQRAIDLLVQVEGGEGWRLLDAQAGERERGE